MSEHLEPTTAEDRAGWANPVQHVSNRPTVEAAKWKDAARRLIADVDRLEAEKAEAIALLRAAQGWQNAGNGRGELAVIVREFLTKQGEAHGN